jgi:hypothetical protein
MSWAASRSTTRIEDAAYSLMGLFNVFMPMLYGEGKRAFIRLQEEIIKQTEDYTIFSWKANILGAAHRGIFAHSPAEFSAVRPERVVPRFGYPTHQADQHPPPALTSRGLVLTLPIIGSRSKDNTYLGWVSCSGPQEDNKQGEATLLCVQLREIQSHPRIFARISPERLEPCAIADLPLFKQQSICVLPSTIDQFVNQDIPRNGEIMVHPLKDNNNVVIPTQLEVADWGRWGEKEQCLMYSHQRETCTLAAIRFEYEESFVVVIGFYEDIPWCSIITHEDIKEQGRTLDGLNDVRNFSESFVRHTDRVKKMLSTTKVVTAAIRVARSTKSNAPKFGLYLTLLESMSETEIMSRGDLGRKRKNPEPEADPTEPKAKVGRTSEAAEPLRVSIAPMV